MKRIEKAGTLLLTTLVLSAIVIFAGGLTTFFFYQSNISKSVSDYFVEKNDLVLRSEKTYGLILENKEKFSNNETLDTKLNSLTVGNASFSVIIDDLTNTFTLSEVIDQKRVYTLLIDGKNKDIKRDLIYNNSYSLGGYVFLWK